MDVMDIEKTTKADKPIVWSPQQSAFLKWAETGRGSCVLEAVAGAGKTTTIIEAALRNTETKDGVE